MTDFKENPNQVVQNGEPDHELLRIINKRREENDALKKLLNNLDSIMPKQNSQKKNS